MVKFQPKIDPEFESLIPPLTDDEFNQLRKNILEVQEVYDPLIVWNGILVDGHNRWKIIKENPDIRYKVTEVIFFNRNEAKLWIINNQLGRRNLNKADAILLAQKRGEVIAEEAKAKQVSTLKQNVDRSVKNDKTESASVNTRKEVAKLAGVSTGTVAQFEQVQKKAPELIPKIKSGEITIGGAYKAVKSEEEPKDAPKPKPTVTLDLALEVNEISTAFITTIRAALTSHSTLLTEENKPKILESLAKAKSRIEEIEKLLK